MLGLLGQTHIPTRLTYTPPARLMIRPPRPPARATDYLTAPHARNSGAGRACPIALVALSQIDHCSSHRYLRPRYMA